MYDRQCTGHDLKILPIIEKFYVLKNKVESILEKQKNNINYDYMTNEQIEIDRLVYEMYNLNDEDIEEVENWYFRRYPKLARVIEEKIRAKTMDGENHGERVRACRERD